MPGPREGLLLRLEPPEFGLHDRVACRRLAPEPNAPIPWVAYGFDRTAPGVDVDAAPGAAPVRTFEWLPAGDTPWWDLEAQALATMRTHTMRPQIREMALDGVSVRIGTVGTDPRHPDPWAAERICDPDAMRQLASALDAGPSLLVAVPVRGFLAAISSSSEPDAVQRFAMAAVARCRGGPNPLSPLVFVVTRGLVSGRVGMTQIAGDA